jgi:hypothetical protein
MANQWWADNREERYFLETTDPPGMGIRLEAPQATDSGNANHPSYVLIKEVHSGDVILHYNLSAGQIALWSRAASEPFEEDIVWGSHGAVARRAGVEPYRRPGWRVLLEGPYRIPTPVTLQDLRAVEPAIRISFGEVRAQHKGSLYLPLELSGKRPLRPTQFYLTKAPRAWLKAIPGLSSIPAAAAITVGSDFSGPVQLASIPTVEALGQRYVEANEDASTSARQPFSIDPNLVDRGVRGHARTQNALASFVGVAVRTPKPDEPQYDLAWQEDDVLYVAEVKSLTAANEERQLRLGLGQVLRYAHLLSGRATCIEPVLAAERKPSDDSWAELCSRLGVRLVWPPHFEALSHLSKNDQHVR